MSGDVGTLPGIRGGIEQGIEWKLLLSPAAAAVNGYARIPSGHPWSLIEHYDDIPVEIHGGLTYGPEPAHTFFGRPHPRHATDWIGFDTMHAGDWWDPELLVSLGADRLTCELVHNRPRQRTWKWDVDAVAGEARALARQIAAAA